MGGLGKIIFAVVVLLAGALGYLMLNKSRSKQQRKNISNRIFQYLLVFIILIVLNLIGDSVFRRIDLTEDERFTVSDASVELLEELQSNAFVTVYYAGEMPTYYKKLQESIRTFLTELKNYSGSSLDFQFIDPSGNNEIFQSFFDRKFDPFMITDFNATEKKDQFVLPYAEITYQGRTSIVDLIQGCVFRAQGGRLDFDVFKAMRNTEYNMMSALYNMSRERTKTIGLLTGHGEYPKEAMTDLFAELDEFYNVIKVDIRRGRPIHPDELDVLMVLQPQVAISDREKYEIDQFVMRGGRVIFTMDQQIQDYTIGEQLSTLTELRATNMDDFFMKQGVKLNYDMIQDLVCGYIDAETYTATFGSSKRSKPWIFHPLVFEFPEHAITRNMNNVLLRFASSIDTFHVDGVRKDVLFKTSATSRRLPGRQYINVDQVINQKMDKRRFNEGPQAGAVLLSGNMTSLFDGRQAPTDSLVPNLPQAAPISQAARYEGPRIALISDGEFAIGEEYQGKLNTLPSNNKAFMLNLIDLMSGQEIMSKIRVREIIDRNLNSKRLKKGRNTILILNLGLPVLLIILFGVIRSYLRRRKNLSFKVKDI